MLRQAWYVLLALMIPSMAGAQGTLDHIMIPSAALGEDRQIDVYTPEQYGETGRQYPVVYVLHGCVCDLTQTYDWIYWSYFGLRSYLDSAIAAGAIQPVIVVTADACGGEFCGSYYTDSELYGNFEQYMTEDVVGYVDANYRTATSRSCRMVLGHSMGGYGAMKLALRHPDLFGAAGSHAGALDMDEGSLTVQWELLRQEVDPAGVGTPYVYDPADGQMSMVFFARAGAFSPNLDNPDYYVDFPFTEMGEIDPDVLPRWRASNLATYAQDLFDSGAPWPYFWLDCGESDELLECPLNEAFAAKLDALGIPYVYETHPGGHNDLRWDASFGYLLGTDNAASCGVIGVDDATTVPEIALRAFPIPASREIRLAFHLPAPGLVEIAVHDVAGREVRRMALGRMSEGTHVLAWDGSDAVGDPAPPGAYWIRVDAGGTTSSRKVVIVE